MDSCRHKSTTHQYERHRPEEDLLYQVVSRNFQAFFRKCEESGHPVPKFIKREFESYLRCGVLSYGLARVYCQSCKYDRLVGFSCKKRGFCGSCLARRISEISGHLIDEVIPEIPTRQWVLSVPAPLRYLMAYDNEALNAVTSVFLGSVFAYLRSKAKKYGGNALSAEEYFPGSVSFIQRFGSALNLNVHIHSQVSDGAFARLPDGRLCFMRSPSPTQNEQKGITIKIARRVHRYLERRVNELESDALVEKEPLLAKCYTASIRYLSAIGNNAGKPLQRLISPNLIREETFDERTMMGFNLHASEAIEADDRQALERTLRYMGRPPLSRDRLAKAPDGTQLVLTLKSPWRNGTEKILLTPFDLLERLVSVIPQPRKNQIRYHGFLAPNSNERKEIIAIRANNHHKANKKIRRPAFALLMARVFSIDILECPRCKSRMQLISCVQDPKAVRDILHSLKMSTAPPDDCELYDRTIEYDSDELDHAADDTLPSTES